MSLLQKHKNQKEIFCTYVGLSLLKIGAKFLGKVTREKQVGGKKKNSKINFIRFLFTHVLPFIFEVSKHVVIN